MWKESVRDIVLCAMLQIQEINTTYVNFYNFLFILSLKIKLKYYSFYQTTTLSRSEANQYIYLQN